MMLSCSGREVYHDFGMNATMVRRILLRWVHEDCEGPRGGDESRAKMVAKVMDKVVVGGGIFHAATSRHLTNTRQKALR